MEVAGRAPGHRGRHLPHQVALQRLRGDGLALPHGVLGQTLVPRGPPVYTKISHIAAIQESGHLHLLDLREPEQEPGQREEDGQQEEAEDDDEDDQ